MTRSPLWRAFQSGDSFILRILRFLILTGGVVFLAVSGMLPMSWPQQCVLALVTFSVGYWLHRSSDSHLVTLTLVMLSLYSSFRYALWRFVTTGRFIRSPDSAWSRADIFFTGMVLLAECYAFVVLALGYVQVIWPLRRTPVPLPDEPGDWPEVDLLIPTYDEPLEIVRATALAAMNIDWPTGKLHVYLLDDGRREEFRAFAEEAGIGYIARQDNADHKAGNINHALLQVSSPFMALFDCDHVPTRSFLQVTMGWFLRDQKLGVVQTPHRYYSPGPFEKNLDQFREIPSEDELYYGLVQDGNDFWNAACFCGSCAILRRTAVDEVGGLAIETLTEDAHTSLLLQKKGWNTAYINVPQAAGLAPERLSGYVRQRVRWARGMVQVLRRENPLFARGLGFGQRLCYFNAMFHFLFALPRLVFLTAPLIYLVLGRMALPGYWATILAYAAPHLLFASITHSRIQGEHRHSFWNEIYETVLAPYILFPTIVAFFRPGGGRFDVTAKGGVVETEYFDSRMARPFLLLLGLNLFGVFCGVARLVQFPSFTAGRWFGWLNWPAHLCHPGNGGIVGVNLAWTLFNIVILGVATGVARETQQRRRSVRVALSVALDVVMPDGSTVQGITADLSRGGVRTMTESPLRATSGDRVGFIFPVLDGTVTLPARVVSVSGGELRASFEALSLDEDEALATLLYSRADAWLDWARERERDRPVRSLIRILRLSVRGVRMLMVRPKSRGQSRGLAAGIVALVGLAALWGFGDIRSLAQQVYPQQAHQYPLSGGGAASPSAVLDRKFTLSDLGATKRLVLRGTSESRSLTFAIPANWMVRDAELKLRYRFSPGLLPAVSQLNVFLNDTAVATLPLIPVLNSDASGPTETTVTLPVENLRAKNEIRLQFIGHYALRCEDATSSVLWLNIDPASSLELQGAMIPANHDLAALPAPFLQHDLSQAPVSMVFPANPSLKMTQAAGIVASWLGAESGGRPVHFEVSIGTMPSGNAVVFAERPSDIPGEVGVSISGPTVAMRTRSGDPYSSVLVVAGRSSDELLNAARALATQGAKWEGKQVTIGGAVLPAPRVPDDAPRWLPTHAVSVGEILQRERIESEVQGNGSQPLHIPVRLAPDLDFGDRRNLPFHLDYRYNGLPLGDGSTLQVLVNGHYVSSTPMPHLEKASPVLETVIPIPVVDLRPFLNDIELRFAFQPVRTGNCSTALPGNLQGAVLKDSYLDLGGIPHRTSLPNLDLFAKAGYPFTRWADLSQTAVVLPKRPSAGEVQAYLELIARMGAQTGYPGLRLHVVDAAGMSRDGALDYLVLGSIADQPALQMVERTLPVEISAEGLRVRKGERQQHFWTRSWWLRNPLDEPEGMLMSGGNPDALIEGAEWPAGSKRSVVAIALRDEREASEFSEAFLSGADSGDVNGSVTVLRRGRFSSYALGERYEAGESSVHVAVRILQEVSWAVGLLTVIFCFLIAVLLQPMLRRQARLRLQGTE